MDTTSSFLTLLAGLTLGAVLGLLVGSLRARGAGDDLPERLDAAAERAVLTEGLDRLGDQLRDLHHDRATWQGQLSAQVEGMRQQTEVLRRETASLSTALRKPQVRGQWGELQLRRAVELAGMVDHCDFVEQLRLDDGARRPDLVVRLAGKRSIPVDAKVPLAAFLDATHAEDDTEREAALARHAGHVRTHVDQLAAKRYWRALGDSPELVVLFLPVEAMLSAALETDRDLIEYAAQRHVVLATPTTLIALLRTVAHGWMHEALAEQAGEILTLGRELHERVSTMSDHVDKVGRSLNTAVAAFNSAVGSLESRVLVTARRFEDLGVVGSEATSPRQVESLARQAPIPLRHARRPGSDEADDSGHTLAL